MSAERACRPNLAYTIAIDPPEHGGTRQMAKMLAASLGRTFWGGEVVVFRNSPHPLFFVERSGLAEVFIETPEEEWSGSLAGGRMDETREFPEDGGHWEDKEERWTKAKAEALAQYAMSWKGRAREWIDAAKYEWIMFLDADCLVLRNLDHLLPGGPGWERDGEPPDILYQVEPGRSIREAVFSAYLSNVQGPKAKVQGPNSKTAPGFPETLDIGLGTLDIETDDGPGPLDIEETARHGLRYGINSGTWAVRGEHYQAVMEEWERIQGGRTKTRTLWREQGAWNRLILDCKAGWLPWRVAPFEPHEIQFPLHLDRDWKKYKDAAILHAVGGTPHEKIEFLFGMFMQKFFGDPQTTLVNILDM